MTDSEREAVAIAYLRFMGMHPSWIEFVKEGIRPGVFGTDFLWKWMKETEDNGGLDEVFKRQR